MRRVDTDLPVVANASEVTSLRVWHCKLKSFASLPRYQNLEELIIASFLEKSIDLIAELPRLRNLKLLHLPNVSSLGPLESLRQLESLSMATLPTWDAGRKYTIVSSLRPLVRMPSLRHLELFGVCPINRSLADLYECVSIRTARFSGYSKDSVEAFYRLTGAGNEYNPPSSFESANPRIDW